jgi:hypothetical protein
MQSFPGLLPALRVNSPAGPFNNYCCQVAEIARDPDENITPVERSVDLETARGSADARAFNGVGVVKALQVNRFHEYGLHAQDVCPAAKLVIPTSQILVDPEADHQAHIQDFTEGTADFVSVNGDSKKMETGEDFGGRASVPENRDKMAGHFLE